MGYLKFLLKNVDKLLAGLSVIVHSLYITTFLMFVIGKGTCVTVFSTPFHRQFKTDHGRGTSIL